MTTIVSRTVGVLAAAGKLPERVGKARLVSAEGAKRPVLDGDTISLPADAEIVFLQEGKQFLCLAAECFPWHGGTDEGMFLRMLDTVDGDDPWEFLFENGEGAFYEYFVPEAVRRLKKVFGSPWVRQGDMYFYPLTLSFEQAVLLLSLGAGLGEGIVLLDAPAGEFVVEKHGLFETRHLLTGRHLFLYHNTDELYFPLIAVVEGTVTHPEHKTVVLEGTHLAMWVEEHAD